MSTVICPTSPIATMTINMTGKSKQCVVFKEYQRLFMNIIVPTPSITTPQSPSPLWPTSTSSKFMLIHSLCYQILYLVPLSYDRSWCWSCVGIWSWCDTIVTGSSINIGSPIVLLLEEKE